MPEVDYVIPKAIQPIIILVEKNAEQSIKENISQTIKFIVSNLNYLNADLDYKIFTCVFSLNEYERSSISEGEYEEVYKFLDEKINCIFKEESCNISYFVEKLNEEMSRQNLFDEKLPYKKPVMLMFGNGNIKYEINEEPFNNIMKNKWFLHSRKIFFSYSNVNSETINLIYKLGFNEAYVITESESQKFKEFCEDLSVREIYAHYNLSGSTPMMFEKEETVLTLLNPCKVNDDNYDLNSKIDEINIKLREITTNDANEDAFEIYDELVKVDPISINDLIDGDWLSGDTDWD